jgi:hypothetical protein
LGNEENRPIREDGFMKKKELLSKIECALQIYAQLLLQQRNQKNFKNHQRTGKRIDLMF